MSDLAVPSTTTEIVRADMTEPEARRCLRSIQHHINSARKLIVDFYERKGWIALGYTSLPECIDGEFDESQATIYRQLAEGRVERDILEDSQIENRQPIPGSHLQALAALPREERVPAYEDAKATAAASGKPLTAKAVMQAVRQRREPAVAAGLDAFFAGPSVAPQGEAKISAAVASGSPDRGLTLNAIVGACGEPYRNHTETIPAEPDHSGEANEMMPPQLVSRDEASLWESSAAAGQVEKDLARTVRVLYERINELQTRRAQDSEELLRLDDRCTELNRENETLRSERDDLRAQLEAAWKSDPEYFLRQEEAGEADEAVAEPPTAEDASTSHPIVGDVYKLGTLEFRVKSIKSSIATLVGPSKKEKTMAVGLLRSKPRVEAGGVS